MSAAAPSAPEALAPGLDDLAFARLIEPFGPFEHRPRLAIGVSGGPDSLALTLLAARWVGARAGSVVGLTVDHGLRPESVSEARTVGAWLRARAIEHVILTWTGPKPATGIQAAARTARYRLLGDYCRSHRILHLVLAHHRDDQAETVALRRARRSGPAGLAGMTAISERRGFRVLRPLLPVPKSALLETLERAGQPWLEDPSNRSPAFARTRLRAVRRGEGAPDLAMVEGEARAARDRAAAIWLARHARVDPLGLVELAAGAFRELPAGLAADILRRVLLTVGGNPYPSRTAALSRLVDGLRTGGPANGRTLAGVLVQERGARLRALRESGAIRSVVQPLDREVWFDHRFRVATREQRPDLAIGPLGERGWLIRRRLAEMAPGATVDRALGQSLPAVYRAGELVAVPALGVACPELAAAGPIRVRFRPRHPLAGAPHAAAGAGGAPLLRGRDSLS